MPLHFVTFGLSRACCVFCGITGTYLAADFAVTEEEVKKLKDEEKRVWRPNPATPCRYPALGLPDRLVPAAATRHGGP